MKIARDLYDDMIAHALEEAPGECCGLVGSVDDRAIKVFRARNATEAKFRPLRFEIDAQEQFELDKEMRREGLEVGAIYHSHTRTEPKPSQTDITFAKGWPGVLWIIVGLADGDPDVRTWLIDNGRASLAELVVE